MPRPQDNVRLLDLPEAAFRRRIARKGVGGTDIGAILGLNRYLSRQECWERKMGLHAPPPRRPAMERGQLMEPIVCRLYQRDTRRPLLRRAKVQHPDIPWWIGSPDRVIQAHAARPEPGVLEVKVLGTHTYTETLRAGVDRSYYAQLQWYLGAGGYAWGAFAVFNADAWAMHAPDVERDDRFLRHAFEAARQFWHDHVLTRTPPERSMAVQHDANVARVVASGAAARTATHLDVSARGEYVLLTRDRLDRVRVGNIAVTWAEGTNRTLDVAALRQAHPEIDYDRFTRVRATRAFRVTQGGMP
jgi:putative phage-type endonuclease